MKGQSAAQLAEVRIYDLIKRVGIITDWTVAIDGGAHVGTWADRMAEDFGRVVAFEPTPETFELLVENMAARENVECHNMALLDEAGRVDVLQPRPERETLTARFVEKTKRGAVRCSAIDDLDLTSCGLIKLDIEGAEPAAIAGAKRTIRRCRPVLCVEIGGLSVRFGVEAKDLHRGILEMGYREVFRQGVDRVYAPK